MAVIIALLRDPAARLRLERAIEIERASQVPHEVHFADWWPEVESIARMFPPAMVVFDPYASGRLDTTSCTSFRTGFPSSILFAYGNFDQGTARDVFALAQLGVCGVATRGVDDSPSVLRLLLLEALSDSIIGEVLAALENRLTPDLVLLVRFLLSQARKPITPLEAAKFYHSDPKTLREHLKRAGLPPTHQLIVWMRLFYAAHLLQDRARSVESVALALNFPSANALRNQLQRYVGLHPKDLTARGLHFLLSEFRRLWLSVPKGI